MSKTGWGARDGMGTVEPDCGDFEARCPRSRHRRQSGRVAETSCREKFVTCRHWRQRRGLARARLAQAPLGGLTYTIRDP